MADGLPGELPGFFVSSWSAELALGNAGELCLGFLRVFTLLALLQMVQHSGRQGVETE